MKKHSGKQNLPIKKENALPQSTNQLIRKATINEKALSNILGNRNPEFWLQKARTTLDKEAWQEAIIYAEKALFYEATFVKADIVLAYAYGRLRDIEKSLFYMERVDRFGEVEAEVYRGLLSTLELYFLSVFYGIFDSKKYAEKLERIAEPIKSSHIYNELTYEKLVDFFLDNPNIHYFMSWDNLLNGLPKEIKQLTNLTSLILLETELTYLPKEIGQLTNLIYLELSNNPYFYSEHNRLISLTKEIGQLRNLMYLDLISHELTSIPSEVGHLINLTKLNLSHNELTSLPKEIGQLTNLTELKLGSNHLSSLPKEIGQLTNLTSLDLGNNPNLDFKNTFQILKELSNLTSLKLGSNHLSSLPKEIGQLTNLTSLSLEENQLSSLPKEIGQLHNLTWLLLGNNDFSAAEKERIKNLLPNCNIIF